MRLKVTTNLASIKGVSFFLHLYSMYTAFYKKHQFYFAQLIFTLETQVS